MHGNCLLLCRQDYLLIFPSFCCGEDKWEGEEEGKRINEQTYSWPRKLFFPRALWQITEQHWQHRSLPCLSPMTKMG